MTRAALVCVLAGLASAASAATDRQTRIVALPAGRAMAIELTVGTVRVEGADRTDAELQIERQAPTTDGLARIPVTIDETPERITVRGLQTGDTTDPAFHVDLFVRVPRTAVIEWVRILEGRIAIRQFSGHLTADIKRGPIDGDEVSGTVRLQTEIGSITLARARLSPDGLLRLRTFNGDIRLGLAERPTDARILALALNGTIKSDIPLTMKDTWGPRWSEATLGKGEPVISLDIVTGKIEIKSP